ncbi:MAG: hypothetical protein KatS3mg081_0674 [Gemmatimonadales bacterium]|nr:MAG: hypothetical protein KatS3mg081_0674 [Gemmatimonadales bacterium]
MELNRQFSFDSFLVGPNNRLAVTAARTVAEAPGSAYNPLFIYSATGLGKTHLLMAVGLLAKDLNPDLNVEYLTLEEFVEAFHAAVAAGQSEAFRKRFSEVGLLLIDDVQFLTHRREMQSELLRLIKELQASNRQIVLASDRPPAEIQNLDERLIAGFAGGLIVDIGKPEFETRLAILRRRAQERGVSFEPGVLEALAEAEVANVRELIGLLNRLIALQAVSDSPLGTEDVRELLGDRVRAAEPAAAVRDEFSQFVSHISAAVSQTVEAWRKRLGEAILRWEAEGYKTARLEALLAEEAPLGADQAIERFERDVARLKEIESEVTALDRSAAGNAVFRDPDRLEEAEELLKKIREGLVPLPQPAPLWTFAEYLAGECNKVALGAARAVCEAPGERYNPLVLVGPAGVGKTHLMHAIGNALLTLPGCEIGCLSAQEFVDDLVEATEQNRVEAWRMRFRRVRALLMDDVHLLAGKDRSQEELFHLFNLLAGSGAQLVFTINRPPAEVPGLDDRLVSRLEGGLVASLGAPDRELKAALARRHLKGPGSKIDDDLVDYLASRPADSVRAVLGMIQRVNSAAEARGVEPTAALAREVLEGEIARMRATRPVPASGILASPTSAVRSREKFVWYWPDVAGRAIEESF